MGENVRSLLVGSALFISLELIDNRRRILIVASSPPAADRTAFHARTQILHRCPRRHFMVNSGQAMAKPSRLHEVSRSSDACLHATSWLKYVDYRTSLSIGWIMNFPRSTLVLRRSIA